MAGLYSVEPEETLPAAVPFGKHFVYQSDVDALNAAIAAAKTALDSAKTQTEVNAAKTALDAAYAALVQAIEEFTIAKEKIGDMTSGFTTEVWQLIIALIKADADAERKFAIAEQADFFASDIFEEAQALYDQANTDYDNEKFNVALLGYIEAKKIFALAREGIEERRRLAEQEYLNTNKQRPGIITTASGLQYEIIKEGTGEKPVISSTVRVHYSGTFINGLLFDKSTEASGSHIPLELVIPGWSEGLMEMRVGSEYRFYIPSRLAYGESGIQGIIPPYATLIFLVELLEIM